MLDIALKWNFESTKVYLTYIITANLDSKFEIKVKSFHANKRVTKEYFDFDEVEKEKRSLQHEIPWAMESSDEWMRDLF